jgi:hypothetical protein
VRLRPVIFLFACSSSAYGLWKRSTSQSVQARGRPSYRTCNVSPASPQTSSLSLNTEELLLHQKDRVATIVLLALLASLHFSTVATTTGDLAQAQSGHEVARLGLHEQPDTFSAPAGSAPPWAHPEPSSSTQEALIDVHLPPSRQGKQHMLLVSMSPLFFFCGVRKISEQVGGRPRSPVTRR